MKKINALIITLASAFYLNACLVTISRNVYLNNKEKAIGYEACNYYAKGQSYPRSSNSLLYTLLADFIIATGLSFLNIYYGLIYLTAGYPVLGSETFPPYVFETWCGNPLSPDKASYNYYYIVDSTKIYDNHQFQNEGCKLTESRKNRIMKKVVISNHYKACNETNCKGNAVDSYFDSMIKLLLNEGKLEILSEDNEYCLYSFNLKGGFEKIKLLMQEN
ncbi:hypothetical protein [Leptospira bandrabouensis]|uniref:hypothetical protein n=1 Tax=Leptospira bandrabouensis TaxID=2484903 RepID=UPI001091710E|nr:hypothetical protein [Leptospira bandrabouensis]TGN09096.1 hypothetical protein EHR07_02050 [Leptospira bandrabouensis]